MKKIFVLANYNDERSEKYLACCRRVGLTPVLSDKKENSEEYDGLLLTGGVDIAPEFYIKDPEELARIPKKKISPVYQSMNIEYDKLSLAVIDDFVKAGKPILGICRGMQVLNVYFGGTLHIDIPGHRLGDEGWHDVTRINGSLLDQSFPERFKVNSYHHQAVKDVAGELMVTATSDDGIIEAAENREKSILAVQWHPERIPDEGGMEVFEIFSRMISAHPNENTASVYMQTADLVAILKNHGSEVSFIKI